LVEKWIPPSRSETAKVDKKKTEGILGVKSQFAPKCKRWHHGIELLNGGKPQKKPKN
jgi:hypothetical protein